MMNQTLDLQDEDRLPWLEPVEDEEPEGVSPLKLLGFIVVGLALLGVIVGGLYWIQKRSVGPGGEGRLIAAQGPYKVRATEADAAAKKFAGEGDASYAASEGGDPTGHIDAARVPEAPMAAPTAPANTKPVVAAPAQKVTAKVAEVSASAKPAVKATVAAGGSSIQLGAYGSQSGANDAWKKLAKRFPYLQPLTNSVEETTVGSATLYRLRARAASSGDAAQICGKLKVAGENCLVVG